MERKFTERIITEAKWFGMFCRWNKDDEKFCLTVPTTWEEVEKAFELVAQAQREHDAAIVRSFDNGSANSVAKIVAQKILEGSGNELV
jgi:hypothetical protein